MAFKQPKEKPLQDLIRDCDEFFNDDADSNGFNNSGPLDRFECTFEGASNDFSPKKQRAQNSG